MTYNPNIPQATDRPSQSQAQILANFTALNTGFDIDHFAFNDANYAGKHRRVRIREGGVIAAIAGEGQLYTIDTAGNTKLWFRRDDGTDLGLTQLAVTTVGTKYAITTPWGQIFNWGYFACNIGGTTTTYATAFSAAAQTIQFTIVEAAGPTTRQVVITGSAAANFTANTNVNNTGVYYFAIGV